MRILKFEIRQSDVECGHPAETNTGLLRVMILNKNAIVVKHRLSTRIVENRTCTVCEFDKRRNSHCHRAGEVESYIEASLSNGCRLLVNVLS